MQFSRYMWLLVGVTACGGPNVITVPYQDRPLSMASQDSMTERNRTETIEIVHGLLNLPSLESVTLPAGVRELRISDSFGMFAGTRIPVVRIVEGPRGAAGEFAVYWSQVDWDPPDAAARCGVNHLGSEICAKRVALESVDWDVAAARLDSLGAWTLSALCKGEGERYFSDAGNLLIQRLEGDRFSAYQCNAPQYRSRTEAGRRAAAIFEYIRGLTPR